MLCPAAKPDIRANTYFASPIEKYCFEQLMKGHRDLTFCSHIGLLADYVSYRRYGIGRFANLPVTSPLNLLIGVAPGCLAARIQQGEIVFDRRIVRLALESLKVFFAGGYIVAA